MTKITLIIEIPDGVELSVKKETIQGPPAPDFPPGAKIIEDIRKAPNFEPILEESGTIEKDVFGRLRSHPKIGTKICAKCGKEFKPQGPRQKYCSEPCGLKPKPEKEKERYRQKKQLETMDRTSTELDKAAQDLGEIMKANEHLNDAKNYTEGPKKKPPKPEAPEGRQIGKTVEPDDVKIKHCKYCGNDFATTEPKDMFCGARCASLFGKGIKKGGKK